MKKKSKSLLDRILFLLNSIIAIVLLLSYILPYISPEKAPSLTILSLFVPLLFFSQSLICYLLDYPAKKTVNPISNSHCFRFWLYQ